MNPSTIQELLKLSREIGREDRGLAMLGEGNTSARLSDDTFLVKASGTCLGSLTAEDVVECRFASLLPLLEKDGLNDQQVDDALLAARVDSHAKKPSVEAVFHAYLLSLPGVAFVGHAHPVTINQILCSPRARDFAERRMFPDEIVCCGLSSVYIPLTDPGLKLAQSIRSQVENFVQKQARPPRLVLMQNHGAITLGGSGASVLSGMLMAEKAARVFGGAAALGGPVFLPAPYVERIAGRPDELYRQKVLNL